jgi:putative transposase
MREWQSQTHVRWYCRYHIVIVPNYRKKAIYGALRKNMGSILKNLCRQFGVELIEGHAMPDHVHLCLSIRNFSLITGNYKLNVINYIQ